MSKYAGIKDNSICIISNQSFTNKDLNIIKIPKELENIESKILIEDFVFKNGELKNKNIRKSAQNLKVALVSNWKMACGLATYAEFLYAPLVSKISDFKIFYEYNDNPTGNINQIGNKIYNEDKFLPCWKRGESLKNLMKEIKDYNPDIVLINHEFGLWPNARHWLSFMNQLNEFRTIVIMHSVFHHKDKTICEAAMPEIVVHLPGAKDLLKNEKGINNKIYVIQHGCHPCVNKEKLWNFYKSDHTFIQAGFGFKYKNFEHSIEAVSILKEKYSDVFLTAIFSESQHNSAIHNSYYNDLMNLIDKLNIQENVAILRGFQSDIVLDCYLRTNKASVFPYGSHPGHEVFGVSGAARIAMTANIPVITSSIPHFSDLPTIKADSAKDIAKQLDILFNDKNAVEAQLNKQNSFLIENSWENISDKYIDVFNDNI